MCFHFWNALSFSKLLQQKLCKWKTQKLHNPTDITLHISWMIGSSSQSLHQCQLHTFEQFDEFCQVSFATWPSAISLQVGLGRGGGALCVEVGFYADISWESRCSSETKVRINSYQILLVFEVLKAMSRNSYNYQKLIKDTQNLTSFWSLHINRIVYV